MIKKKIIKIFRFLLLKILNMEIKYAADKAAYMLDKARKAGDSDIYKNIKYTNAIERYNNLLKEKEELIGRGILKY